MELNPVLVEVVRGSIVESIHRGAAIAMTAEGVVLFEAGDCTRPIYPRSALKLFQAIPLIASGAAERYKLTDADVALACASHNGEKRHVDRVITWLSRLGLGVDDLECGAALSISKDIYREQIAAGLVPTRAHHNCSGKHTAMLTVCRKNDYETAGYSKHDHPVQKLWMDIASDLTALDMSSLPWERDGCGLPAVAMPLKNLALGFARFAEAPDNSTARYKQARTDILSAIQNYPTMIAGTGRCCTAVADLTGGSVIVKTGAEGVFGGCVPTKGIGFALKIDDGAFRASEVALGGLVRRLNLIDDDQGELLRPWFQPAITNSQGFETGSIRPSNAWY